MARPLKEGGGGLGCASKEKRIFSFLFVAVEKLNIFCLRRATCRNIDISVLCLAVGRETHSIYRILEIFALKYGSFSPKIVEKKNVKIRFRLF